MPKRARVCIGFAISSFLKIKMELIYTRIYFLNGLELCSFKQNKTFGQSFWLLLFPSLNLIPTASSRQRRSLFLSHLELDSRLEKVFLVN